MSRPTSRLLAVLELLQAHGRMSGAELARRLGVDGRTIRRYIVRLEEMGIPITADRGSDGAYALVAGFKLPPMLFTDDEAVALSVGLLAARALGVGEAAPAVASAQAKLERVMPEPIRRRVRAISASVALDLRHPAGSFDGTTLATLSSAAQDSQRVHLSYQTASGEITARDVDPYGVGYREGRWYAAGWCHLRGGLRSFRLDRVRQVVPRQERFVRPADFDPLAHVARSLATLPRAFAVEVVLATDLANASRQLFGAFGTLEPIAEGLLLRSQSDDLAWTARELARLPFAFTIRQPAALGDELHELARRLARAATTAMATAAENGAQRRVDSAAPGSSSD